MISIFQRLTKIFTGKKLPHIQDHSDLSGHYVLIRADFNVPMQGDASITPDDAWRIEAICETITYVRDQGAKIILISHAGNADQSLRPVAQYLQEYLDTPIGFVPEVTGTLVEETLDRMGNGHIILLENLRSDVREKNNHEGFAELLSTYADIYVNEAFSASHREHASIVGVPQLLPTYFGFQFHREYEALSKAHHPKQPLLLMVGGAKFDTKLPLIEKMLPTAEHVFIGGALAHTFFKYQGIEIGNSLVEEYPAVQSLIDHSKISLPFDVIVQGMNGTRTIPHNEITSDDRIVDLGPLTLSELRPHIQNAGTIIWNGPVGWYEGGFDEGTQGLLQELSSSNAFSIIGGGDTVAVIRAHDMADQFGFVSTAGGAMLDFLSQGSLPGIDVVVG